MTKAKTFEQAIDRLNEIVSRLENGESHLEEMLKLYEEGMGLIKFCLSKLDDVEKKISTLNREGDDELKEEFLE
jgi:exodeoxyribonuclease VII small subunit